MPQPRLVVFAGSLRSGSLNKRLVPIAAAAAREAGAEVTELDLSDFRMPLYDGDLEASEGMPDGARRFRRALVASDGFVIAAPEYNSSMTGALKNAIDWASRKESGGGDGALEAFRGKVAGLVSASPGGLGGLRGLAHLRDVLGNLMVHVVPEQTAVSRAHELLRDGAVDEASAEKVRNVARAVVRVASALAGAR